MQESYYSEEHKAMQNTLKKIIDTDINPNVDQWEADGEYPAHEVFKKLGDAGLMGVTKPVEYGGLGLDFSYSIAFNEALGHVNCGAIPMSIAVQTDMSTPALAKFGNEKVKSEFLEPAVKGDVVSSIGVSEPGGGSDVASVKTTAKRVGDDLVINGSKMWITNAFQADWVCLLANDTACSDKPIHMNKSLICVPMDTKGITLAKKIDKLGMRASDTAVLYLEDVRVPAANIIGDEGMGFSYQMIQFQEERLACAALSLVPLEKCITATIDYTRQRKAFGKPLLDNQVIHFTLAELATELELLRAGLYQAVDGYTKGNDVTQLASMLKLKAGRLGRIIPDKCLQYWGGMGFTNEVMISRMYRDMRLTSIGGGADEVMLGIISKYMGTLPAPPKKKKAVTTGETAKTEVSAKF